MIIRFVICVVENKRIYFRGRAKLEIDEQISEEKIREQKRELIEIGKKILSKHLKARDLEIAYVGEVLDFEDALIFEYRAKGKELKVIFKHTGPIGYFLAKFFPIFF